MAADYPTVTLAPYVVLRYRLAEGYLARRGAYRAEHLELVGEYRRAGLLALAGALDGPADEALLVFATDDLGVAEAFAARDPYVREGLVVRREVRGWSVVA